MNQTSPNSRIIYSATILLALALCGCQDSRPLQLRYDLEKSLFETDKMRERFLIRPELITDSDKDTLRNRYRKIFYRALVANSEVREGTNTTELKSIRSLAFRAAESARQIDFLRKDYGQALVTFTLLIDSVELSRPELLMAKMSLGRSAQANGDWPSARATFKEVIKEYYPPLAPTGNVINSALNLPYDIYRVERHLKVHPALGELKNETEQHYLKILDGNFSADLNFATHALLSSFYQSEERFDEALAQLEFLVDSTGEQLFEARLRGWNILINNKGFYRPALDDLTAVLRTNQDTLLIPMLRFKRAECYLGLKRYDSCRSELNGLKNDFRDFFFGNPIAQTMIARSFELEGKWDRAQNEYRWLAETFSTTEEGFRSYLYILDHYEVTKNARSHSSWSERALDFYTESARRYPNTPVEATALSFQAEIHRRNQDWQAAARALEQVSSKFSESDIGRNCALNAAIIYKTQLNDPDRADSLLIIYRSAFPDDNKSTE